MDLRLTKLGLWTKSLLNFFIFGFLLFFLPEKYFNSLGIRDTQISFIKSLSVVAIILGAIYSWGMLNFPRIKLILFLIYLDALVYPIIIFFIGFITPLPWSFYLSALLVALPGICLILGKSHQWFLKK